MQIIFMNFSRICHSRETDGLVLFLSSAFSRNRESRRALRTEQVQKKRILRSNDISAGVKKLLGRDVYDAKEIISRDSISWM